MKSSWKTIKRSKFDPLPTTKGSTRQLLTQKYDEFEEFIPVLIDYNEDGKYYVHFSIGSGHHKAIARVKELLAKHGFQLISLNKIKTKWEVVKIKGRRR